jgi:hypothetical protein
MRQKSRRFWPQMIWKAGEPYSGIDKASNFIESEFKNNR